MSYLISKKIGEKLIQKIINASDPYSGSLIIFTGRVRKDRVRGKYVREIEYEAYKDMAEKEIRKIEEEAKKKFKVKKVFIKHRTGKVKVGEIAFFVGVLSAHRKEGFSAIQFIVDNFKRKVPVWKKEVLSNGSTRWKEEKNV
jgi:molybdopterin synthase catalytic subunit